MSDKPYNLPPALTVADMCAMRAWDDDVDDQSRMIHEMAADTIRLMHKLQCRLAHCNEQAEATNASLAEYIAVLSGQKGGAA
ncbi:MAG: hypothetical protein VKK63_12255 [Synechococcus sp.]|nr:hypothetical protein [Synechococcus sp.]